MKAETLVKQTVVGALPLAALALTVYFFGDKPVIREIKEGLKGNTKA